MVAECAVDLRPGARGKVSFWFLSGFFLGGAQPEKRMERRASYAL
jgi:hypothetical protein